MTGAVAGIALPGPVLAQAPSIESTPSTPADTGTDTSTTLLGSKISYPAITAPMGNQALVHAQGDIPNVKGAGMAGTLYCVSSVA